MTSKNDRFIQQYTSRGTETKPVLRNAVVDSATFKKDIDPNAIQRDRTARYADKNLYSALQRKQYDMAVYRECMSDNGFD